MFPLQSTKVLKVVLSDGTDELTPNINPDTNLIDCADEGVNSSAFQCASASVSSDTFGNNSPVCCVIAVGSLITSVSANLSPRHRTRNGDMTGYIWMLCIEAIESIRRDCMMPIEIEEDTGLQFPSQEYQFQQGF